MQEREAVDEIPHAFSRQRRADEAGDEFLVDNQIRNCQTIEAVKYKADSKTMFEQLNREKGGSL